MNGSVDTNGSKCLADLCGALHCDHVMNTKYRKPNAILWLLQGTAIYVRVLLIAVFPFSRDPQQVAFMETETFLQRRQEANKCSVPGYFDTGFDAASRFLCSCFLAPKRNENEKPRA